MAFKGHKDHQEALLPLLSILTSTFSHLCATAELAVSLLHALFASAATPGKGSKWWWGKRHWRDWRLDDRAHQSESCQKYVLCKKQGQPKISNFREGNLGS